MYAIAIGPQSRAQTWIAAHEARVDGPLVDVTATRSGRIHHLLVTEGEAVERGIRLAEMHDGFATSTPERVAIRAPARGRVLTRHLLPRQWASFGQRIITLVEDDDVWMLARFGAADFEQLDIGQSAVVMSGGRCSLPRCPRLAFTI
jgi:multidrug resistance efflux pump